MDKSEINRVLETDFTGTFIDQLIPGILHNFANPLNGIMGRSKLLQRRIGENVKKIEEKYPDVAMEMMEDLKRIKNDISAINQEADYFFDLFKDVSGKFYTMAAKNEDRVNISQLLDGEMRFLNFYLDFKHEVSKNMEWDNDIPELKANAAELSLAFWRIIHFFMSRALNSRVKKFYIKTEHDHDLIKVSIRSSDDHIISQADLNTLMDNVQSGLVNTSGVFDRGILFPLLAFNSYRAKINLQSTDGFSNISIGFPSRAQ